MGEPIADAVLTDLAADFSGIYIMHTFRASPEESVWFSEEGCTRQESMFQVRAWYKKHGLEARDWRTMADDHLVAQLQFIAYLLERASETTLAEAATFMDEHLLRWIDRFAQRVCARCESAYFAGLASLTGTYLHELRGNLAGLLGQPIPSSEEIEARMNASSQRVEKPLHFVPGVAPTW
jgi:TorA maturation chaperone TorD